MRYRKYIECIKHTGIIVLFATFFVGCSDFLKWFYPNEDAYVGSTNSGSLDNLLDTNKKGNEITEIEKPVIEVSQAEYGNKIVVSWNTVEHADSYKVYKRKKGDSFFIEVKELISGVLYDDEFDLDNASFDDIYAIYEYTVEALTFKGIRSGFSQEMEGYLLLPPRGLGLVGSKDSQTITIQWRKVKGGKWYRLYRSETEGVFGKEIRKNIPFGQITYIEIDISLKFAKNYYYYVVVENSAGEKSMIPASRHPFIFARKIKDSAPRLENPPVATKAEFVDKIVLTWEGISSSKDIRYNVYRKSTDSSRYIQIAQKLSVTTYEDKDSLIPQVDYTYYIEPIEIKIGDEDLVGAYTKDPDRTRGDNNLQIGYVFSSPNYKTIIARRENNAIRIVWRGVRRATMYKIYSSSSEHGNYAFLVDVLHNNDELLEYVHSTSASAIFYKIISYRNTSEGGPISTNLQSATPIEPIPDPPTNVSVSRNKYFSDFSNVINGVFYPIKITWTAPQGAVTYSIERAQSNKKVNDIDTLGFIPLSSDISGTEIYDDSVFQYQKYYYYRVIAYNSLGVGGDVSVITEQSKGYPAITNEELLIKVYFAINQAHNTFSKGLIRKSGTSALGDDSGENTEFSYKGVPGRVKYSVSGGLSGGQGYVTYKNIYAERFPKFGDLPLVLVNGRNDTSVSVSANGYQTVDYSISGMYPATVIATGHDFPISNGSPGEGRFTVNQNVNKTGELVDGTLIVGSGVPSSVVTYHPN